MNIAFPSSCDDASFMAGVLASVKSLDNCLLLVLVKEAAWSVRNTPKGLTVKRPGRGAESGKAPPEVS